MGFLVTAGLGGGGLVTRGYGVAPGAGGGAGEPDDFWEAVIDWATTDATVTALFPGGVVNAKAAARQVYPFLRVSECEEQEALSADDWAMELHCSAYVEGSDVAAREQIKAFLRRLEAADRPALDYRGWRESGHLTLGKVEVTDLGRAPGSSGVKRRRADVLLRFFLVRNADNAGIYP